MLVLFQTVDPDHPKKPPRDRLINSDHIVDVEPVYAAAGDDGQASNLPQGSILTLSDKRKVRIPHTPRVVQRAIKTGSVEGAA